MFWSAEATLATARQEEPKAARCRMQAKHIETVVRGEYSWRRDAGSNVADCLLAVLFMSCLRTRELTAVRRHEKSDIESCRDQNNLCDSSELPHEEHCKLVLTTEALLREATAIAHLCKLLFELVQGCRYPLDKRRHEQCRQHKSSNRGHKERPDEQTCVNRPPGECGGAAETTAGTASLHEHNDSQGPHKHRQ